MLWTVRQPNGALGASKQCYVLLLLALVMTAAPGDEFAEYAAAIIPSLRRLALLLCRNWHDADDLVQAALSKLCQHWYRAAAADSTDAYVRAILVREFVRGRRTAWARRVRVTDQPPELRAPVADLDARPLRRSAVLPARSRARPPKPFPPSGALWRAATRLGRRGFRRQLLLHGGQSGL